MQKQRITNDQDNGQSTGLGNGADGTHYALGSIDTKSPLRRLNPMQTRVGFALLALLLPYLLNASYLINNDFVTPKASKIIEEIGDELSSKTAVHAYVIATNDRISRETSLYDYSRQFESNMSKPFILFIFAPNDKRVGLVPSSEALKELYDADTVKDAAIDVVASADKNSKSDKYNIGIVQGYSELADQIARSKGVEMTKIIPNDTRNMIAVLKYIVIFGSILVLWILVVRPIYMRIRYGKQ